MPYSIKNWREFQHYKDRLPPWIKLHREVLNDMEFMRLSPEDRGVLMLLWVLACESGGTISDDQDELAWRLRVDRVNLETLVEAGFLIPAETAEWKSPWPSRYIPDSVRSEVLTEHGHKCVECGSTENLEIDHVIPVSAGGTSEKNNLQVLCRSCNRRKRVAVATQSNQNIKQRSLETETETETEREGETEKRQKGAPRPVFVKPTSQEVDAYILERGYRGFSGEEFVAFYQSKGWVIGKQPMKDWKAAVTTWAKRHGKDAKRADGLSGNTSDPNRPCAYCGGPYPCKCYEEA